MPCFSQHYWSQYKKYLHDYYVHNSSKANADPNLNGDDENGLAALLADSVSSSPPSLHEQYLVCPA
jgi:hypothetical protein